MTRYPKSVPAPNGPSLYPPDSRTLAACGAYFRISLALHATAARRRSCNCE